MDGVRRIGWWPALAVAAAVGLAGCGTQTATAGSGGTSPTQRPPRSPLPTPSLPTPSISPSPPAGPVTPPPGPVTADPLRLRPGEFRLVYPAQPLARIPTARPPLPHVPAGTLREVPWRLVGRSADDRTLVISYLVGGCQNREGVLVTERPDAVRIDVLVQRRRPNLMCPDYERVAQVKVPLSTPLDGRKLLHGPVG